MAQEVKTTSADAQRPEDRRASARRRAAGAAYFRPANNLLAPRVRVTIINFSYGGVCFLAPAALVVGQRIVLDIHARSSGLPPIVFEAEVRWVAARAVGDDVQFGCAWSRRLTYGELQQMSKHVQ